MPIIRNYRTISGEIATPLPPQPRVASPLDDLNGRSQFIPKNATRYRPKLLLNWFKTDLDRGFKIEVNQPKSPSFYLNTNLDPEELVPYKPAPFEKWRTDLTYLKFGKDRFGGGSSGQPYKTFPIPDPKLPRLHPTLTGLRNNQFSNGGVALGDKEALSPEIKQYYDSNRVNRDFPARGGGINAGSELVINPEYIQSQSISSKIDKQRIEKFIKDPSKGYLFIKKQQDLQQANPKIETGKSFSIQNTIMTPSYLQVSQSTSKILENTRTYNVNNTLFQIGISGTGYRALRTGNSPFNSTNDYYEKTVKNQQPSQNRLLTLTNLKLGGGVGISALNGPNGTLSNEEALKAVFATGISLNKQLIQDYSGGPGSTYGIGNTTTKRVVDTSDGIQPNKVGSLKVMTYEQLAKQNPNNNSAANTRRSMNIQDYSTGQRLKDRDDVYKLTTKKSPVSVDPISNTMFQKTSTNPWGAAQKDLIKFGFEFVNNDSPGQSTFMQFRAYLNNGFTDSNTAQYNTFKYLGRGEEFFVYQGFSRTISFGFTIVSFTSSEVELLYGKLNMLLTQVQPDYSPRTQIMRAPLTKLTLGDYVYRVPGFIESVNVTANQDSPWGPSPAGIAAKAEAYRFNGGYAMGEAELPHYVNVDVTFKPISDALPSRDISGGPLNTILQRMRNETSVPPRPVNFNNIQTPSVLDATPSRDQLLSANQFASKDPNLPGILNGDSVKPSLNINDPFNPNPQSLTLETDPRFNTPTAQSLLRSPTRPINEATLVNDPELKDYATGQYTY